MDGDAETGNLAVAGEPPFYLVGNPPEIDYISRGDFLELLDLDNPASPSSSSDDSSCLTSSSDECFDSLALLQELDSEINWHSAQKNESCKFSVSASFRPNEVVMAPISPGLSNIFFISCYYKCFLDLYFLPVFQILLKILIDS